VTQYDVKLVHSIEELIGHQLSEYSTDEAEVLKGITRVYAAKRAAMLAAAEAEGVNTKDKRIRRLAKQL
jgi:ATP-dependent RNA helicase DDX49/DBP8